MAFAIREIKDQRAALVQLVQLVQRSVANPTIVSAARRIVQQCPSKDDECELVTIYEAVRRGTRAIPGMEKGFRYVADPIETDWFQGADRTIKQCAEGICAGDCDEHAVLVAALCAAIGFPVGLRIWGPVGRQEYEHIYAVAGFPKLRAPEDPREWLGMDTTEDVHVGWDPPNGRWVTAIAVNRES